MLFGFLHSMLRKKIPTSREVGISIRYRYKNRPEAVLLHDKTTSSFCSFFTAYMRASAASMNC